MQSTDQTYKIVSLTVENIKRVSAVHLDIEGNPVVVIGGENGQGKSSILDAVEMALGGLDAACKEPVRHGTGNGRIVVDLGDIIITRKFVEGSLRDSVLEVRSKAGARFSSPQAMLSSMIGRLGFDPMEFDREDKRDPKKRERILRELAGIKTDDIEAAYDKSFEERTAVNRSVKTLQAQFDGYHHYPEAPPEEVSIADLTKDLEAANQTARALDKAREEHGLVAKDLKTATDAVATAKKEHEANAERIRETEREIAKLQERLGHQAGLQRALYIDIGNAQNAEAKAAEVVQAAIEHGLQVRLAVIDTAPIKEKIAAAEGVNRQVRANATYAGLKQALDEEKATAQRLTDELDALNKEKTARLAAAKFPIDGLAIDDRGVVFKGVPYDQASQAERIRVAVAISAALNPKLRVILIREGGLLDRKSMKLLAELAHEHDLQLLVEKVAEGNDGSLTVLIEDGHIAEVTPAASSHVHQATDGLGAQVKVLTEAVGPDEWHTAGTTTTAPVEVDLLKSHRVLYGEPIVKPAPKFKQGGKKSQEAA